MIGIVVYPPAVAVDKLVMTVYVSPIQDVPLPEMKLDCFPESARSAVVGLSRAWFRSWNGSESLNAVWAFWICLVTDPHLKTVDVKAVFAYFVRDCGLVLD